MDIRCLAIVAILMLPCSCYAVASLKIQSTTSEDDLNSFKVWNSDNHSSFSVYFSEDLENVASQAIPQGVSALC
ncbi:hypothetical protein GCM10009092_05650 [Bowmanella denitrificans]|uniref:Uncharacterized protein n=1 Tax=Bowmanella denitrificans TaxID=366582 RepID=A0ABP3GF34_9ALTE